MADRDVFAVTQPVPGHAVRYLSYARPKPTRSAWRPWRTKAQVWQETGLAVQAVRVSPGGRLSKTTSGKISRESLSHRPCSAAPVGRPSCNHRKHRRL